MKNIKKDTPDFIPNFRPKKPKKFTEEKWPRVDEPQVILFQGMRGSGKGVAVDKTAEELYNKGLNIWHIWAARSFENLYWAINKNCREHYSKLKIITDAFFHKGDAGLEICCLLKGLKGAEFEKYRKIALDEGLIEQLSNNEYKITQLGYELSEGLLLHCKCHNAYPIVWIVPEYIEVDQESLDRFNGVYWKDFDEYGKYLKEISREEKKLLFRGKLEKPYYLRKKPLIVIKKITPPTNASRKETFQKQFTEIVLQAREERRIVVMNPAIFEFAMDKFDTLSEIIRMIPYLMNKSGYFKPLTESDVGKQRKYWNKWQKSWHKVAIVINELRSVAPSSRLSGERESSISKKAIFDFIPEARHNKTWFLGDYQNPDDLYAGVRYQANVVVIKRASRNILGNDWAWLFDKIERDRMRLLGKAIHEYIERPEQVWHYEKNPKIKKFLDDRRPRIGELPDNIGYLTSVNGEVVRWRFDMPSFHHKTSLEDFQLDTGIKWKVNTEKKPKESDKSQTTKQNHQKKAIKQEICKKIHYMHTTEGKSFKQVKEGIVIMEKDGVIPDMGYEAKEPIYFNNLWNRWKNKNKQEKIS